MGQKTTRSTRETLNWVEVEAFFFYPVHVLILRLGNYIARFGR